MKTNMFLFDFKLDKWNEARLPVSEGLSMLYQPSVNVVGKVH